MSLSKVHFIHAAEGGKFSGGGADNCSPADVDVLFEHLKTLSTKKLVLHFHGGLVSVKVAFDTAERMQKTYDGHSHAVSFIWETGGLVVMREQLEQVSGTELYQKLRDIVIEKVCQKLGLKDGARGNAPVDEATVQAELQKEQPFAEFEVRARGGAGDLSEDDMDILQDEIEAELQLEFSAEEHRLEHPLEVEAPTDPYFDKSKLGSGQGTVGAKGVITWAVVKSLAKVAFRVIKRFRAKTDHRLLPTVAEEILRELYIAELAKVIWDGIKSKAVGLWAGNTDLTGDNQHAGMYFLKKWKAFSAENPGWTLDLVGHSAGSIVICEMLKAAATIDMPNPWVRNVILLAPACRADLFAEQVIAHPERYANVQMFTMTETAEHKDNVVILYPSSLLYLVSGLLESKDDDYILGLHGQQSDRAPYGQDEILKKVRQFFAQAGRLTLSPTENAPEGFGCTAKKHGDFDDDEEMLKTLARLASA